jgi:hypothetical protein
MWSQQSCPAQGSFTSKEVTHALWTFSKKCYSKASAAKKAWVPKKPHMERPKTPKKEAFYEGTPFVSSFM